LVLHDTTIVQIVKLIQMAFLTGTDIVDHLRTLHLEDKDGQVILNKEYEKIFEDQIKKMLENSNDQINKEKESSND
jgi:hypothetical protein